MWGSILFGWSYFLNILPSVSHVHVKSLWKSMSDRGWGKGESLSPTNIVMCTATQVSAAVKLFMHGSVPSSGDLPMPSSLIFSSMPIKVCYRPWNRGLTLMSLNLDRTSTWIPCWWDSSKFSRFWTIHCSTDWRKLQFGSESVVIRVGLYIHAKSLYEQ